MRASCCALVATQRCRQQGAVFMPADGSPRATRRASARPKRAMQPLRKKATGWHGDGPGPVSRSVRQCCRTLRSDGCTARRCGGARTADSGGAEPVLGRRPGPVVPLLQVLPHPMVLCGTLCATLDTPVANLPKGTSTAWRPRGGTAMQTILCSATARSGRMARWKCSASTAAPSGCRTKRSLAHCASPSACELPQRA